MEPLAPAAPGDAASDGQSFTINTAKKRCRSTSALAGALSLTVALILQAFCWGFTVDDAWIVSRVASHGAETGVFAFNNLGPATDAITPFGFAHLLGGLGKMLGRTSPLEIWQLARMLGVASYSCSFFVAGYFSTGHLSTPAGATRPCLWAAPLTALALPAAAWSGAGLATPVVGLLVLIGAVLISEGRRGAGSLILGIAGALRPELMPFVAAVVFLSFKRPELRSLALARSLLACVGPSALVVSARLSLYGHPLPLSATAKVADLQSGLFYAAMTMIWGGLSWLILTRDGAWKKGWALPWCAHLGALVYAGGDWMPALRLSAPLMPWLVWVIARDLRPAWPFYASLLPAIGFPLALGLTQGDDFRHVTERRLALVEACRPHLASAQKVAAADVGWVGLCTDATIIDLGGVTDPTIARLPGGHTSKMVSPGLFSDREVDTWVIRALDRSYRVGDPLETVVSAYMVDARLLRKNGDLGFEGFATIPLGGTQGQYIIARRVDDDETRVASRRRDYFNAELSSTSDEVPPDAVSGSLSARDRSIPPKSANAF